MSSLSRHLFNAGEGGSIFFPPLLLNGRFSLKSIAGSGIPPLKLSPLGSLPLFCRPRGAVGGVVLDVLVLLSGDKVLDRASSLSFESSLCRGDRDPPVSLSSSIFTLPSPALRGRPGPAGRDGRLTLSHSCRTS
mmetsp:Transcript_2704/g.2326  ORF Transcript_2704/g.2326 Transcript_2704/m.2326 type:complete len:134 (-) Transcript_2704:626-1027(-)